MNETRLRGDDCLNAETVAEYVDRRLDPDARRRAEAHLADCDFCRDATMDVSALTANELEGVPRLWRRSWLPLATVAAAAVLVAVVGLGVAREWRSREQDPLGAEVGRFVAALDGSRVIQARLSPPFGWAPLDRGTRGAAKLQPPLDAREAALRIERLASTHRNAATLAAVGMAKLALGEIDDGIAALEDSVRLEPSRPEPHVDLAAAYLARWETTAAAGDASRALNAADTALRLSPKLEPAVFNRALSLEALGLAEAAAASWQDFLAISEDENWRREASARLNRLKQRPPGTAQVISPELLQASATELDSIAAADPARLERAIAESLPRLLDASFRRRDAEIGAARAWSAALVRADRDRFWPDVLAAALSRGAASLERRQCLSSALAALAASRSAFDDSDYDSAERHATGAVSLFTCARTAIVEARMQVAWTRFFRERRDDAVVLAAALRPEAASSRYWRVLARSEYLNGLRAIATTQPEEGFRAYASALDAAKRADDVELLALVSTMQAEAYRSMGEPEIAWRAHAAALPLLPSLSPRRRHVVLAGAALTATQSGHHHAADALTTELVRTAADGEDGARLAGAHLQRARTLLDLDRADDASQELARTDALIANIGEPALRRQYRTEFEWLSGVANRSINPALAVRQLEGVFEALAGTKRNYRLAEVLLERGRARKALGDLSGASVDWGRGIEYFEREGAAIGDRQLRISRASKLWDLFGEMIDAHLAQPVIALSFAERSRARTLLDDAGGSLAGSVEVAATDWIPVDVDLLYYAALRERLVIWHITHGGIRPYTRPVTATRLEQLVGTFIAASDESSPGASTELSALLLPDGVPSAPGRRIIFLPDGALHRLPFSLLTSPSTGRRLFEDAVPMIAPSLSILRRAGAADAARVNGGRQVLLVGVGGARPEEGLQVLPGVDEEIGHLVRLYHGARLTVLAEREATAARMVAEIGDADLIHFAGHAVANDMFPSRSKLVMASDGNPGELTAADIAHTRLRPGAVVVLSACDTARGRVYRGEGSMALARPFLASGASAVLATLWKVRDAEATPLMRAFHERLRAGLAPGRALVEAKRASARQGNRIEALGAFELMTSSLKEGPNGW